MGKARRSSARKTQATELLPVKLSDEEILAESSIAARRLAEREQLLEERATAIAGFKERIQAIDAEVRERMRHVREGAIEQEVRVEDTMDWNANSVVRVRLDTGEVVRSRSMTPEERQGRFRFDDGEGTAEGGAS
jgi:hypothetical protein